MSDMDGKLDELLGKEELLKALKDLGWADERVNGGWERLQKIYIMCLLQLVFEHLPEDQQRLLKFGLNPVSKVDDGAKLMQRIDEFVRDHPDRLPDKKETVDRAVKMAYNEFEEWENEHGGN